MEDGGVLGAGDTPGRLIECFQVDVLGTTLGVVELRASHGEPRAQLDQGEDPPLPGVDALLRYAGKLVRSTEVARGVLPAVWAGEVDELPGGEGGRQALARLGVEELPARLGDRCVLAEQVAHPSLPRKLPSPRDSPPASGAPRSAWPSVASSSDSSPCSTMSPS